MPRRRMLAALAAVLSFGTLIASPSGAPFPATLLAALSGILWILAVAIAAVILAPTAAIRRARPSRRATAAALAIGALLVYPVYGSYYTEREWALEGGGVGHCTGILPLPEALQNQLGDDEYARVHFVAGCND